ncbi:MAG: hypothetical protein ACK5MT_03195 [Actinomycetales bacterium]
MSPGPDDVDPGPDGLGGPGGQWRWRTLPHGVGTRLAIAGQVCVAAESGRIRWWGAEQLLGVREVGTANPASPRVLLGPDASGISPSGTGDPRPGTDDPNSGTGDPSSGTGDPGSGTGDPSSGTVLWGPYRIGIGDGRVSGPDPLVDVATGYRLTAHAWSADGRYAVLAGARLAERGPQSPAACWLVDQATGRRGTLWEGSDRPPDTVCCDDGVVVLGHRQPTVYDLDGTLLVTLPGLVPPTRVSVLGGLVLLADSTRLAVFDLPSGAPTGLVDGLFVDGVLAVPSDGRTRAPGGDAARAPSRQSQRSAADYALGPGTAGEAVVLAVDAAGRLTERSSTGGLAVRSVPAAAGVQAIAAASGRLLAAFGTLPGLRVAQRRP